MHSLLGQPTSLKLFNSQDLISNSPYCLPNSSCDVSLENLVLDQLIIPYLIFFFILITCLLDNLYWYCKEKFRLGHSRELEGNNKKTGWKPFNWPLRLPNSDWIQLNKSSSPRLPKLSSSDLVEFQIYKLDICMEINDGSDRTWESKACGFKTHPATCKREVLHLKFIFIL